MKVDALILDGHAPTATSVPRAANIEITNDAATTTDAASSINIAGFAVTLACALMSFGLGYGCYVHTGRVFNALAVAAMVFLPLRVMLWIAIRN